MWLYYCKLRGANDFESVNQLIVADKMFEMLDSETATHIGVLQGEEWYKPRDLGKQCDIFYASKGKSYDEPERAKWNDSEKRSFNGSWDKQPFGEKKSDNFSSRKNFDKGQVTEIKKFACFTCGSDKHFKRDCPKNKEVDNKRLNVNKVSTEGTELVDGTVAARVDLIDGKLVHALVDAGTEITVIKKDLVPGISVEGASTIYLKGIFGPAVKCPLVYVPIGLATGGQVNVVHQQVLCALAEVLVEDVLLPPEVLDMLGGAQSEENSLAQSSQDLRVDSGNVDETEVSLGILPEKAQEHIEDSQRNITSCRNEVVTLGTKDEEVTAEMDKGSMVADSFRSEQECCAELALAWKYAKEGKGNYYEVDGYLFRRDKILGESIGQLVIPKCRRTEVLKLAHTSVFSSHMGPKKTLERIKYSFFWEGLRANVKKFCESCKECQLTRSVRIKDRSSSTPVARLELPFEVGNMDLIGPIDSPSLKGHKYILCLVDQHTRWGEAVPLTSLSAKITCEAWLNIFSRTEIYLLSKREGFVEKNSAASWVTVLDLWKWYFCRSLTKNYAACFMPFGICMTKKVRFKIEYTSYGCNLTTQVLRMLEQFVVSRIVDIDILMQIWKNRVKQINVVLEWVGRVRSRCLHLATGRTRDDIEKKIWQRQRRKGGRNGEERGGEEKPGGEKKTRLDGPKKLDKKSKNKNNSNVTTEEKLNRLKDSIKGTLTRLEAFTSEKTVSKDTSVTEIEIKLKKIEQLQINLDKIAEDYCEIEIFEILEIIQLDIEDINQRIEITEVGLKLLMYSLKNSENVNINLNHNGKNSIRLPQIPLPEFSGVIAEFSNFKNQFISLISNNEQLNDSQKLYYLRASLKGEAKLLESPSDSFDSLFSALEDRYENKRQLIDSHVLEIINHEKIYSESAKELRALMDCINRNIRALKVLKYEQNDLSQI
ncbi:retrovirus-related Pol polyprotein from transposon opus [Trichonephila clavipes]|uniref:RNA-directed DNA polymerase n=1 Tax=Trichonephila clavipes TaxID=2585209 RepID=A0A8X6V1S0_TRICX|nr:retrovirus-related Pol polyprotein from transposon opus [Trichonephila clavipes]